MNTRALLAHENCFNICIAYMPRVKLVFYGTLRIIYQSLKSFNNTRIQTGGYTCAHTQRYSYSHTTKTAIHSHTQTQILHNSLQIFSKISPLRFSLHFLDSKPVQLTYFCRQVLLYTVLTAFRF